MKKILGIFLLLVPMLAHAQTYGRYQNCSLKNAQGQAISGAQVYFLTQPANTTTLTPLATIYSNATGAGGAITNPVLTNGFGECTIYAAPGLYTAVYVSPFTGTLIYADQLIGTTGGAVFTPTGIQDATTPTTAHVATELEIQAQAGLVVHTNAYFQSMNLYSPIASVGLAPSAWAAAGGVDGTAAIVAAINAAKPIGAYVFVDPPPAGMVMFATQFFIGGGEGGLIGGGHHYEVGSVIYKVPGNNQDMVVTDPGLSPTSYLDYYLIDGLAFYGDFSYTSTAGKCVNIQVRVGERTEFNRSSCNNWAEDGFFFGQGSDPFFMTDLEGSGDGYNCPGGHLCGGIHFQNPGGDTWQAATLHGWSTDNDFTAGVIIENASNYNCLTCGDYFKLTDGKMESRYDNLHEPNGQPVGILLVNTNQTPITIDGVSAISVDPAGGGGFPVSTAVRSGGTIVITTPTPHVPAPVGSTLLLAGNSQSAFNVVLPIIASTQTTTTVTQAGGSLTGTGGNIFFKVATDSLVKITGSSANVKINNVTMAGGIDPTLNTAFGWYNIIHDIPNSFENNVTSVPNHTADLGGSWVSGEYEYPNFCADIQCTPASRSYDATLFPGADIGAKINGIITFCAGAVCPIYIPAGSYAFTTPIVLASNVDLYGAGEYLTNLFFNPGSAQTAISGTSINNTKIHDLQLQSTVETPSSSTYNPNFGISIASGNANRLEHIGVAHFWGFGSGVVLSSNNSVIDSSDIEYTTFGIGGSGTNNRYTNNYVSNHFSQAKTFESPGVHYWDGIAVNGTGFSVQGNTTEDTGQSGIYIGANSTTTNGALIVGNNVFRSWNRGIDTGVSGDINTSTNFVTGVSITGNNIVDSRADNIWIICNQNVAISGNYAAYTGNYNTFFSGFTITSRSGLAIGDTCGSSGSDTSSYVTAAGNSLSDVTGTQFASLNLNIKSVSTHNYLISNVYQGPAFIAGTADLTQNMMQFNPSNIFTTTSTAPGGSCATPNGFVPVVVNGVTLHIATCP